LTLHSPVSVAIIRSLPINVDEPVLVLNRNFEPLNVCNTRRAVGLLMVDRAEPVEIGRGHIRTANSTYPRPGVIRLKYLIRRPRPRVKLSKREIFRRDDYGCQYCGEEHTCLTIDHVIPRRSGGPQSWENLLAACPACNRRKRQRALGEAHMQLRRQPAEPQPPARYLYGRQARHYREWARYLEGW
jgi:5-methylcytosine-specific restriction endonuclease McrA